MSDEIVEAGEEESYEIEENNDDLKYNIVYFWKNYNHFSTFDKIDMRSRKARLKIIKLEKRNIYKNMDTDGFVKGGYKSCIII